MLRLLSKFARDEAGGGGSGYLLILGGIAVGALLYWNGLFIAIDGVKSFLGVISASAAW